MKFSVKRLLKKASALLFFVLGIFFFFSQSWSKTPSNSEDFLNGLGLDTAHADYPVMVSDSGVGTIYGDGGGQADGPSPK